VIARTNQQLQENSERRPPTCKKKTKNHVRIVGGGQVGGLRWELRARLARVACTVIEPGDGTIVTPKI